MSIQSRFSAVCDLGRFFREITGNDLVSSEFDSLKDEFHSKLKMAGIQNPWFTADNLNYALKQWGELLTQEKINDWLRNYKTTNSPKRVGIVMAGNIPLVGFHDLISVLLSGHQPVVKLSSKDTVLMKWVIDFLSMRDPELKNEIKITERLTDFDAVIATGSNNTARYFEYYFEKYPHIIRKNRTAVSVLDGSESEDDLKNLSNDIFRYFGLGCRNVTRIYLPQNYNTDRLFESFFEWKEMINHSKYSNNYEYNRAVFLMSEEKFLDNNFVILKESESYHSPIGVIHYSYYKDNESLRNELVQNNQEIQCIVGNSFKDLKNAVGFGVSQKPALNDYADGVDVMKFLEEI